VVIYVISNIVYAQTAGNHATQLTTLDPKKIDEKIIKRFIGRWHLRGGCIFSGVSNTGNYWRLNERGILITDRRFIVDGKTEPELVGRHTYHSARVVSEPEMLFELNSTYDDFVLKKKTEVSVVYKFLNSYSRTTYSSKSDGKIIVENGRDLATQKETDVLYNCDSQEFNTGISATERREMAWAKLLDKKGSDMHISDSRSREVAMRSKTKWLASNRNDQMTGKNSVTARTQGQVNPGSYFADIFCENDLVKIRVQINNTSVPVRLESGLLQAAGRARTNSQVTPQFFRPDQNYRNVFYYTAGRAFKGRLTQTIPYAFTVYGEWEEFDGLFESFRKWDDCTSSRDIAQCYGSLIKERQYPANFIHDVAIEITTSSGLIFIELPPGDTEIKKVLNTCR